MLQIHDLYDLYKVNLQKKIRRNDALNFYHFNANIISSCSHEQEKELAYKWTHNKFVELLEYIHILNCNNFTLDRSKGGDSNIVSEISEIENTIFKKNCFEKLYNKFIFPKAILTNDIDYKYSEEELKYYANLSYEESCIISSINTFSDIFDFDNDTSLEKRRSMRKKSIELFFAGIYKLPVLKEDSDFQKNLFSSFDTGLEKERAQGTDKEWGSLHNVLYGFISGTNMYRVPYSGMTHNSHYGFLIFVPELMSVLKKELNIS